MLVGDIYGDRDYSAIGLSASTIASSFGKVSLPLSVCAGQLWLSGQPGQYFGPLNAGQACAQRWRCKEHNASLTDISVNLSDEIPWGQHLYTESFHIWC